MHFSSMLSMWFALALPLIVLMYLFKRKYEDMIVPSHYLWNRVLQQLEANRPWQKLNIRLLLILQLLAAALLVLALMQPMLEVSGRSYSHAVLVLDRSASMQVTSADGESRLDRAKQQLIELVQQGIADEYTFILLGNEPEVAVNRTSDRDRMKDAISEAAIDYGEADLYGTLSLAESLAAGEGEAVIVFTDGHWPENVIVNEKVSFVLIRDSAPVQNVYVAQFGVIETDLGEIVGSGVIGNSGETEQTVDLSLVVDGQLREVREISITAGGQTNVYFTDVPRGEVYKLEIDAADFVRHDNEYYAFVSTNETKTALIAGDGGNLFLQRALELAGVRVIHSQPDETGRFIFPETPVDVIVLNGVEQAALTGDEWEKKLDQLPVWLFGSLLEGPTVSLPNASIHVHSHPVTEYVQLTDTHVAELIQPKQLPWPGLEPIVTQGNRPLVFAGEHHGQRKLVFTFQLSDSDLPLRTDFPIIVFNSAHWLTDALHDHLGTAIANSQLTIPLAPETSRVYFEAADLHDGTENVNVAAEADLSLVTVPNVPGLYRFIEQNEAGDLVRSRYLHVISDAAERSTAESPIFGEDPSKIGSLPAYSSSSRSSDAIPLAAWLAAFVLFIIVLEWGVYQRARSV